MKALVYEKEEENNLAKELMYNFVEHLINMNDKLI